MSEEIFDTIPFGSCFFYEGNNPNYVIFRRNGITQSMIDDSFKLKILFVLLKSKKTIKFKRYISGVDYKGEIKDITFSVCGIGLDLYLTNVVELQNEQSNNIRI